MRTKSQIKQQLKQVTYRYLQRLLRQNYKKKPTTCGHNRLDVIDEDAGLAVRVCGFIETDGKPRNVICDPRVEGCNDLARDCPLWSPLATKEQVKEDFHAIIQSGDRGTIAAKYPDIAALLWVLDDPEESDVLSEDEVDEAVQDEAVQDEAVQDEAVQDEPPSQQWFFERFFRRSRICQTSLCLFCL